MSEWKTYRLEELCTAKGSYGIGAPAVAYDANKYTYLRITDINDDGTLNRNGLMSVDDEHAEDYILKENDIVFARTGNSTGRTYFYDGQDGELVYAGFLIKFSLDSEKVNPRILKYYTHSQPYYNWVRSFDTGGTRGNINAKVFGAMPITLPPRRQQDRIVEILKPLDDKIELNRRINANLEAQAQALFRSWFVDNKTQNNNPGFFNNIIQTTLSGDWGQETPKGNYISEVYCIRGVDIPDIKCGDKGKLPTRYILEKNLKNKKLSENDLVVEISGGSPTQSTGRICLITRALLDRMGKDVICTNFCRALKPIPDYSFFIYLYWQYLYNNNTMFSYENGTTGIKNLNITDFINKEPIIIPEKKKILEFNKVLQPIFDMIYKNGRENKRLSALRDTLLPKLMAGNIRF